MTAALPMGAQKITGMADPSVATDGATKNYVDTTTATFFSTGDIKLTLKTSADSGWLLFDDGTFGSGSSGSSNSNSINNLALFTLLFNNLSDTAAPLLTSGGAGTTRAGQTNAATAWAANCRMSLPKTLGRALAISGSGSGLTARALAATVGEESHTLSLTELPTGITSTGSATMLSPVQLIGGASPTTAPLFAAASSSAPATTVFTAIGNGTAAAFTPTFTTSNTSNNTSGGSHNNMQPTVFLNAMIKV